MKLVINYDLINQITMANTGINFKRIGNKMKLYVGLISTFDLALLATGQSSSQTFLIPDTIFAIILYTVPELVIRNYTKSEAELKLRQLCSELESIHIYTTPEFLKEARLYKTKYKLVHDDGRHALQQDKYMLVQTTGTLNNSEISLLQEHEIGSREYVLSIGEPKRAYEKKLNSAWSRQAN